MARPTPPSAASAAAIAAAATHGATHPPGDSGETRKLDAEEIGKRMLRLLEPLRLQSLSLHNIDGDLLWLSEGVFGPDEHGYVLDALDVFALEPTRQFIERRVEDGRRAFFLCARTPLGDRCGLAALLIDTRVGVAVEAHLGSPRVASSMRRFSMLLAPARAPGAPAVPPRIVSARSAAPAGGSSHRAAASTAKPVPQPKAVSTAKPAVSTKAAAPLERLTVARAGTVAKATPRATERTTPRLLARRFARLRAGGVTHRCEVFWGAAARPTGGAPSADLALAALLIEHLQACTERYQREPATFLVPLSAEAVRGQSFFEALRPLLRRSSIDPGVLGFRLPPAAWSEAPSATQSFLEQCRAHECFAAFDDFELTRPGFALLSSPAVRCLKLESSLIASVMSDKLSQASVAALVQATRVLGVYCVAKEVPSLAIAQWLVSAGVDFSDNASRAGTAGATTDQVIALETPP